jgi:uncharacterized alpha-E superfamily protein
MTTERAMRALGAAPMAARMDALEEARLLTFGGKGDLSSIHTAVFAARENARQVRDQITTEMWERLTGSISGCGRPQLSETLVKFRLASLKKRSMTCMPSKALFLAP